MTFSDKSAAKRKATMIKKHGSEAKWREALREIGREGGKASSGYEFAHGKVDPKKAGKKGAERRWSES